jgi:hypothetical protein
MRPNRSFGSMLNNALMNVLATLLDDFLDTRWMNASVCMLVGFCAADLLIGTLSGWPTTTTSCLPRLIRGGFHSAHRKVSEKFQQDHAPYRYDSRVCSKKWHFLR